MGGPIRQDRTHYFASFEQINEAIRQMDDVTQQNAALVEDRRAGETLLDSTGDEGGLALLATKGGRARDDAAAPAPGVAGRPCASPGRPDW